ncbi:MAG: DUF3810 family protein [Saprospiraceae bacterium]
MLGCVTLREGFAEQIYFNIIYLNYRRVWSLLSDSSPFPLIYAWLFVLSCVFIFLIKKVLRRKIKLRSGIFSFLLIILAHLSYFYLFWGFNYFRSLISDRMQLNGNISSNEFIEELRTISNEISVTRNQFCFNEITTNVSDLNSNLSKLVCDFLERNNLDSYPKVKCRLLRPNGSLLIWSTAGIYWPFAGESQIDAGLHPLEWPFTMAHELAHGMGWTDEGECNFIAYMSCQRSDNKWIKYSGELSYWKYLVNQLDTKDSLIWNEVKENLNPDILLDVKNIRMTHDQYPYLFPSLRNYIYDSYLKVNQVKGGSESYNDIIRLVINYKKRIIVF